MWMRIVLSLTIAVSVGSGAFVAPAAQQPGLGTGTGLILGRVIDGSTGEPIGDARVMLFGVADWVLTNGDGHFVYFNLPAGDYRFAAKKPGYAYSEFGERWVGRNRPAFRIGVVSASGQSVSLKDGERRSDVVIRLWKYASVGGRVVDEHGEPVVGAPVQARARTYAAGRAYFDDVLPAPASTDDRGIYRIPELLPGEYAIVVPMLSVTLPARLPADGGSPGPSWNPELFRALRIFRPTDSYSSVFGGPGSGEGVSIGEWLAVSLGHRAAGSGRSAESRIYPSVFYAGAQSSEDATPVRLAAGEDRAGVDFALRSVPARRVCGTVSGPAAAASNVTLRLVPADGGTPSPLALAVSDSRGRFCFAGVPSGAYTVQSVNLSHQGRANVFTPRDSADNVGLVSVRTSPWSDAPTWWASSALSVGDRDVEDLPVQLHEGFRISGTVVLDGTLQGSAGPLLDQLELTIDSIHGRPGGVSASTEIEVRPDGSFRSIEFPPGSYFVRALRAPAGWTLESVSDRGRDVSVVPFDLDADIAGLTVTLTDRPATLTGIVRTRTGGPDALAAVAVFPADSREWVDYGSSPRRLASTRVDPGGRYQLVGLPPGDYYVAAVDEAVMATWQSPALFEALRPGAERLHLDRRERRTLDLVTLDVR